MGWSGFSRTDFTLQLNVLSIQTVSSPRVSFTQSTLDKNSGRVNSSEYHLRFYISGPIRYSAMHPEPPYRPTWHLPVTPNVHGLIGIYGNEPNASRAYETSFLRTPSTSPVNPVLSTPPHSMRAPHQASLSVYLTKRVPTLS